MTKARKSRSKTVAEEVRAAAPIIAAAVKKAVFDAVESPKTVRAALLDGDGVYLGMDDIPADLLTDRHLPEVGDCDLPPGKYRWDADRKTFLPLARPSRDSLPPEAVRAIALGFLALSAQGAKLPRETQDWLKEYASSFDFKGND